MTTPLLLLVWSNEGSDFAIGTGGNDDACLFILVAVNATDVITL
jgi:hypothetical protein